MGAGQGDVRYRKNNPISSEQECFTKHLASLVVRYRSLASNRLPRRSLPS